MKTEITAADIIGTWKLQSWLIHYPDERPPGNPFGSNPSGQLLYGSDGYMSATVHRSDRPVFPAGISPRQLDNDLITSAYWSYFHYAGPYRITKDSVIHHVEHSLNPAMVGTEQVRKMKLKDKQLTLTGIEPLPDGPRTHELIWLRANS